MAFQFTRPRGARPVPPPMSHGIASFNSRAREGRDTIFTDRHVRADGFNSRAREGRDNIRQISKQLISVSIHAPARGATCTRDAVAGHPGFQFTRPRGARPRHREGTAVHSVSIHAPARGATSQKVVILNPHGFNSRAREGRDLFDKTFSKPKPVSIHAPARGATEFWPELCHVGEVSIHAPARGATMSAAYLARYSKFQFTRPRGARPFLVCQYAHLYCFNSRAREGRDRLNPIKSPPCIVSIHAPARGATNGQVSRRTVGMFQFTRPRGARPNHHRALSYSRGVSIHAPARGATMPCQDRDGSRWSFNSRAREGRD